MRIGRIRVKVLLAEDNEETLNLFEKLPRVGGYEVVCARNGIEALEKLRVDPVDMIISDIFMPKMDGFRLCIECKKDDALNSIPVVLMSSEYFEEKDENFAQSIGAERFIRRPIEPKEFIGIITDVIKKQQEGTHKKRKVLMIDERSCLIEYNERLLNRLEHKVSELEQEISERKRAEEALKQKSIDFGERVKELHCLYEIAILNAAPDKSIDEVFEEAAHLIPPAWYYPEITCARIAFGEHEFMSDNFRETPWRLSANIFVLGKKLGAVDVFLLEKKYTKDNALFLKEERTLIDALANQFGQMAARQMAEEQLKLHETKLKLQLDLYRMADATEKEIMAFSIEASKIATQSQFALIGTMSADETMLIIRAWSSGVMEQCAVTEKPIQFNVAEAGLWGEMVRKRRPIIVNDYETCTELKKGYPEGHVPIKRFLGVPIFSADRIVAVAAVANKSAEYTGSDVRALTTQLHEMWSLVEHNRIDEALRESEGRFRQITEAIEEVFWLTSLDGQTILYVSPAFEKVWGRSCADLYAHSQLWSESILPDDAPKAQLVLEALAQGVPYDIEFRILRPDGTVRWINDRGYALRDVSGQVSVLSGVSLDITERKKLEAQLLQSQKMEAIGQLAGGIAHDFNNIITGIIGFSALIDMHMAQDDPQRDHLNHVLICADRAADLTKSLLAFGRKQIMNPQPIDLNRIISKTEKFLKRIIGEDIDIRMILHQNELVVHADSGQIEQVLMNLATNARDAMPHGGTLSIETSAVEINADFIRAHGYGEPGEYALVSISDNGMGMDGTTCKRLFEPFFTTKELGKGTGLGLPIVYGIVKQHNGYINVYSEPGVGTTFTIYLPLLREDALLKANPVEEEVLKGGTETILVADDDATVLSLTEKVLKQFGYTVITAVDGVDAVAKFSDNRDKISLVILDVIMPNRNGKETFDEIRAMCPDMKALFISGYTADIIHKRGTLDKSLEFLTKPIRPMNLLRKVRDLLDGAQLQVRSGGES